MREGRRKERTGTSDDQTVAMLNPDSFQTRVTRREVKAARLRDKGEMLEGVVRAGVRRKARDRFQN